MPKSDTTYGRIAEVRFVSANFEMLQGLVVAPGMLVVAVLMYAASTPVPLLSGAGGQLLVVALGIAATVAAARAARRYQTTYGIVRSSPRVGGRYAAATFCALAGVLLVRLLDLQTETSPEGVVMSVVAILFGRRSGPAAPPIVTVGALGLLLSVLPLGRWTDTGSHPFSHMAVLLTAAALAQVVVAIWCHLVLRRVLAGVPQESQ
jgi:hypothetical protein